MKHILLLLLFAFATSMQAQEVTSDSTYLSWENSAWFRVTTLTYSNGNTDVLKRFIGDTATLYSQNVDRIRSQTATLATDVSTTSAYGGQVGKLLRESDEILARIGRSPADSIEADDAAAFLVPGWTIRSAAATTPITFNQTNAKKLRYQNVTATNRQTDLIGAVIRLRDFPTSGTITDFYRVPNGRRWVNLDRIFQLIPPGGSAANR